MGKDLYESEDARFHARLIGGPCDKCRVPSGLLYLHGPDGHVQLCTLCALNLFARIDEELEDTPLPALNYMPLPSLPIRDDWQACGVRWFTTSQVSLLGSILFQYTIGAVLTRTAHGAKAYLGVCFGHDMEDDIRAIAQTGCRLDTATAQLFFPNVTSWSET